MESKTKFMCGVSLLLSAAVLVFCYANFDGQISEPYRAVSSVSFYGILGGPVAVALVAMVLGIMAWMSLQVMQVIKEDTPAEG